MLKGGKKKQQEKEAIVQEVLKQVNSKFKEYENSTDASLQSKFEALNRLLEDHPDKRVSILLNSISEELRQGFLVAKEEVDEIKKLKEEARRSLEEIRSVQKEIHLDFTRADSDRLRSEIKSLATGDSVEDIVRLVLHCIATTGWSTFDLRTGFNSPPDWEFCYTQDSSYSCLWVSATRFPWIQTREGRKALQDALSKEEGVHAADMGDSFRIHRGKNKRTWY